MRPPGVSGLRGSRGRVRAQLKVTGWRGQGRPGVKVTGWWGQGRAGVKVCLFVFYVIQQIKQIKQNANFSQNNWNKDIRVSKSYWFNIHNNFNFIANLSISLLISISFQVISTCVKLSAEEKQQTEEKNKQQLLVINLSLSENTVQMVN